MAEGLKALYETELRYEVGNLGVASEERQSLSCLLSVSSRTPSGELCERNDLGRLVVERSPRRPQHDA